MKNILLLFLLLSLLACQEEQKNSITEISIAKNETIEKRNEVVISVNDTISSFFINLFVDDLQDKPDMLYLGKKEQKTSVVIPTQNAIRIIGGDPFISLFYELKLQKGDSLLIDVLDISINKSTKAKYPVFSISNSDKTWSEINFDYLLYTYNIEKSAIVVDDGQNFRNNSYDYDKIYQNAIKLLDSLKASNSISNAFHSTNKIIQKLKFATSKLREARYHKTEIDIDDLGVELNNEALFTNINYIGFLRALILYKYFNKNKRVLNSVLFDFIANNETFLRNDTKNVMLDAYLKSIFFIEKSKFKKYLKTFNTINTNEELKNKWKDVLHKQELNTDKLNKTDRNIGVLTNLVNENELTFEEVLLNYKGKVVLVDFWASWCSPCRKEMPHLEDLKSKFDEDKLKIIEISIDKDYAAWVRASELENLSKEKDNYIISNWEKSSLYKTYKIKTIPRYLLFGKDGKIINDDAPRPSETELIKLIKTSL
ncbi:thioredoxin-like domain-containing protein [uncultured Psychroserpens sp.]|uniref:thioredoxin-like domain-containing protein n=1 Tax=uncultured Psychroserpens sp. TaxID=255436 RepID=UPI002627983C|nr:thioredoxin-like domain-containing protein [uncultured Psychroserpens sp.]